MSEEPHDDADTIRRLRQANAILTERAEQAERQIERARAILGYLALETVTVGAGRVAGAAQTFEAECKRVKEENRVLRDRAERAESERDTLLASRSQPRGQHPF